MYYNHSYHHAGWEVWQLWQILLQTEKNVNSLHFCTQLWNTENVQKLFPAVQLNLSPMMWGISVFQIVISLLVCVFVCMLHVYDVCVNSLYPDPHPACGNLPVGSVEWSKNYAWRLSTLCVCSPKNVTFICRTVGNVLEGSREPLWEVLHAQNNRQSRQTQVIILFLLHTCCAHFSEFGVV